MPKVTIWIRNEDIKAWEGIKDKPEWLHKVINLGYEEYLKLNNPVIIKSLKVEQRDDCPPNILYMMNSALDYSLRKNGTFTDVNEPNMDTEASITLLYPNNTSVTITGDGDIIKQLVDRLNGQVIDYTIRVPY